jgi:predicted nucleotidyltransferase
VACDLRHDDRVELRPGLIVEDAFLAEFATRHEIARLAVYGSVLRDDFGPARDIDILVELAPGRTPGLLHLAQMELELEAVVGRFGRAAHLRGPQPVLSRRRRGDRSSALCGMRTGCASALCVSP